MKNKLILLIVFMMCFNAIGQQASTKDIQQQIDDLFKSYAHYNRFIGNVLISQNNKIIYQKSFGYADLEHRKKNKKSSIF
ncbi:MAG: hypothetical protein JKZ00_07050, partial [Flavobacteriaceae bacterium]|nr:hypothetical protein [Flavobacteriaceae bacterium]